MYLITANIFHSKYTHDYAKDPKSIIKSQILKIGHISKSSIKVRRVI